MVTQPGRWKRDFFDGRHSFILWDGGWMGGYIVPLLLLLLLLLHGLARDSFRLFIYI
jgi:hypothetical protein